VRANQTIAVGDTVDTVVDAATRVATTRTIPGRICCHAALREVLGKHVKQRGSLNDATPACGLIFRTLRVWRRRSCRRSRTLLNRSDGGIRRWRRWDVPIQIAVEELGAMALFGEKYGERVRVVKIGDFSTELCGGFIPGLRRDWLIKIVGEGRCLRGAAGGGGERDGCAARVPARF